MKVLILGSNGMLGSKLISIFRSIYSVYPVTGWDVDDIDITKESCINKIVKEIPKIIVNCAAYTNVDDCEINKDKAYVINAEGVKNISRACKITGAKLIHLSTDYIFDGSKQTAYTEDDLGAANPLSVYGKSKLQGEEYIRHYLDEDSYIIVRTAWLYGENGKHFVDTILRLAEEKRELKVVHDQEGSPTYTKDLSEAIISLIERDCHGTFHITNSGSCTWYEFARRILAIKGKNNVQVLPITTEALNRPALRPRYSVMDCSKLIEHTGVILRSWEEALKDYLTTKEQIKNLEVPKP